MSKEILREFARDLLRTTRPAHDSWSKQIRDRITRSPRWKKSSTILLFASLSGEPDLLPLVQGFPDKRFAFPRVIGEDLEFRHLSDPKDLFKSQFSVREPDPEVCPLVDPSTADQIFVPGLAFDRHGYRLGRGRGFYDRFLARLPSRIRVNGVFFSIQRVRPLPVEPHDIPLHYIFTEIGTIRPAPKK
jgi:5-formyltetrahydrofolate cyclo-ligase